MFKRLGCLAFLIMLGLGAFGVYSALYPPHVGGVAFSQLPPRTQKERRAQAQTLVEQVEKVAHGPRKGIHQPFNITATEQQLNTLLQDRLRTEKFPIHDLSVGLTPGQLTVQGSVKYQGFDVPANLVGSLAANEGQLEFKVDSLTLSGLPAPGNWKEKAQRAVESGLQRALGKGDKAYVDSVTVESGKLTVAGTTG